MHTAIVILGGVLLLGTFLLIGRLISGTATPAWSAWALWFIPVWLLASAVNLWVGVKRAGYTVSEELPIFLGVFAVPAIVAAIVWWRLSRS